MKKGFSWKVVLHSLIIAIVGVFGVDYFSHLFFSTPMETLGYFLAKAVWFFIFSIIFLSVFKIQKKEFWKIVIAGIVVAAIWGAYYNVLPAIFGYYPFGIALKGLTFWGMGLIGTGIAFGIVHTLAFIVGYYLGKLILGGKK